MKMLVLVKEVPDTYGDRKLDLETGLVDRAASDRVLDEISERSIEAAISFKESNAGTDVVVLAMGPESLPTTLRKGLAMGADSAVHVFDEQLAGADLTLTAQVLAAAVRKVGDVDVVLAGNLSTDGEGGVIPAMVAELLGWPHATFLSSWEPSASGVTGVRATDEGDATVNAPLPAVISITEAFPDPRFPNFKGIMAAKKKPFATWSLADIGVDPAPVVPRAIMTRVSQKPARAAGVKIIDAGDAGEKIAAFLIEHRLV